MLGRVTMNSASVVLAVIAVVGAQSQTTQQSTVYRDTWGVPHIYAESTAAAAYGLGYAQAEDRVEDLFINIRTAIGTMAEAFGPDHVERDYLMRLTKNAEVCATTWPAVPEPIRVLGDAFVRGVEAFLADHPERRPPFAFDLEGWHTAAVGRAMILNWPIQALFQELARKQSPPSFGSNSFAIAPSRSAENCAIVMTDPHLTWEGMAVFYEARVHSPDADMCGFWVVGSPLPALGHGRHVAWACTTGGPDTSDVFIVTLNPENPMQYRYDGEWHDFTVETIRIAVRGGEAIEKTALYTQLGPVIQEPDIEHGVAYCGASPYFTEHRLFEQSYRMVTAKDCDEFYDALAMNQLMEQNVSFADRQGAIQYVRVGNTPIRPEGVDYSRPVRWSEETRWRGTHPIADLVQIKNPPQGYLQNCNISPANMTTRSPMTPDKYPDYIYHVTWDQQTPRGARMLALLDADDSVTKEAAMRYTVDVYDILAQRWIGALATALKVLDNLEVADPDVIDAGSRILHWNGEFTTDSQAAPIVRYWRLAAQPSGVHAKIARGDELDAADLRAVVDALIDAVAKMKSTYGTIDITWGDINLIGRGGKYFGSPGAEFGDGGQMERTETVMDVATRELEPGSGKYVAYDGSSAMMVSFLYPDGIQSYSLANWGQSGDPESPHYVDQAEKLYATRTFKPTWFDKDALMEHVASEKVLEMK